MPTPVFLDNLAYSPVTNKRRMAVSAGEGPVTNTEAVMVGMMLKHMRNAEKVAAR